MPGPWLPGSFLGPVSHTGCRARRSASVRSPGSVDPGHLVEPRTDPLTPALAVLGRRARPWSYGRAARPGPSAAHGEATLLLGLAGHGGAVVGRAHPGPGQFHAVQPGPPACHGVQGARARRVQEAGPRGPRCRIPHVDRQPGREPGDGQGEARPGVQAVVIGRDAPKAPQSFEGLRPADAVQDQVNVARGLAEPPERSRDEGPPVQEPDEALRLGQDQGPRYLGAVAQGALRALSTSRPGVS